MTKSEIEGIIPDIINSSIHAGLETLEIYKTDIEIFIKEDNSPVTVADQKSNEIIISYLEKYNIPILSEETSIPPYSIRKEWNQFWMIDPLDGTKEFIKKNGDYTINIALIENNVSILGVIYVPVYDTLYVGLKDVGSFKMENATKLLELKLSWSEIISKSEILPNTIDNSIYTVVASKSHLNEKTASFIANLSKKHNNVDTLSRGSSLKLCMVAEGKASIYPRFGPTMEWDIAAGAAIVENSGAKIFIADSKELLTFNKENLLNPEFIAER